MGFMKKVLKKAARQAARELKNSSRPSKQRQAAPKFTVQFVETEDVPPPRSDVVFSDHDPEVMSVISGEQARPVRTKLDFSNTCPYCGVILDKPIKRKRNCPECDKPVYVRTTQDLYPSSALTESQVNDVEFYETMKATIEITLDDYRDTEGKLMSKWNVTKVNTYDVLWSMFNNMELYTKYADKSYDKKSQLRNFFRTKEWVDVAAAKYQASRGHDPSGYLGAARKNAVQSAKLEVHVKGLTVKCYNCCDDCMKFDEKTFSLEFLDKNEVLPNKICTRPYEDGSKFTFCTCTYQDYYNWDDE
jgi:hypothetical protein